MMASKNIFTTIEEQAQHEKTLVLAKRALRQEWLNGGHCDNGVGFGEFVEELSTPEDVLANQMIEDIESGKGALSNTNEELDDYLFAMTTKDHVVENPTVGDLEKSYAKEFGPRAGWPASIEEHFVRIANKYGREEQKEASVSPTLSHGRVVMLFSM